MTKLKPYVELPYLTMVYHKYTNGAIIEYTCSRCQRTVTVVHPGDDKDRLRDQVIKLIDLCEDTACRLYYQKICPERVVETLTKEIRDIDSAMLDKRTVLD